MSYTREDFITLLSNNIRAAVPGTGTSPMTYTEVVNAFNATANTTYTVDPTKKGTIKQIQYE